MLGVFSFLFCFWGTVKVLIRTGLVHIMFLSSAIFRATCKIDQIENYVTLTLFNINDLSIKNTRLVGDPDFQSNNQRFSSFHPVYRNNFRNSRPLGHKPFNPHSCRRHDLVRYLIQLILQKYGKLWSVTTTFYKGGKIMQAMFDNS